MVSTTLDLKVEQFKSDDWVSDKVIYLSDLNIDLISLKDMGIELKDYAEEIDGQDGLLDFGATYSRRELELIVKIDEPTSFDYQLTYRKLMELFGTNKTIHITRYMSLDEDKYNYEIPGDTIYSPKPMYENHTYRVRKSGVFAEDKNGTVGYITIGLTTTNIPFGFSDIKTLTLKNGEAFTYNGTAELDQRTLPMEVKVTGVPVSSDANSYLEVKVGSNGIKVLGAISADNTFIFDRFTYTRNNISIFDKVTSKSNAYYLLKPQTKYTLSLKSGVNLTNTTGTVTIKYREYYV